ncbi:MAG TPA: hypothetical protein VIJ28_14075 [Chloroflexota bacterium]
MTPWPRRSAGNPAHRNRPSPIILATLPILLLAMTIAATPALAATALAAPAAALAYPRFGGPLSGVAAGQSPLGADFSFTCNEQANAAAVTVAGQPVPAGAAITNTDNCGQAYLFVSAPGAGRFQARIALADDATIAGGGAPEARIFVLAGNGYTSRTLDIALVKGVAKTIDLDLAGAVMLAVGFPNGAPVYVSAMRLTGTARIRHITPLEGGGMASGGTAVAASQMSFTCNAAATTTPKSVSHLIIPTSSAIEMTSCGVTTIKVPAGSTGTLAARFGAGDLSDYTSVPTVFDIRVLDAAGHLLRKAIGLAFLGGGLQPIWVNLTGGATVTLTADTGNAIVDLVGLALLPGQYKQHPNPDHNEFGSPTGSPVSIVPESFAVDCNAHPGDADITVDHVTVLRDTFLSGTDCGVASLVMTNARGAFHALVGLDDTTSPAKSGMVRLTVLDQYSRPLFHTSTRATIGKPAITLNAPITGASIVKLEFYGPVVLYDLQLTGRATFYDRVFPPSEPPTSGKTGIAVNPTAFTVSCNTAISRADILLIHAAALEQWALDGQDCGTASLNLRTVKGPRAVFAGRYALPAAEQRFKVGHVLLRVLGPDGKTLRTMRLVAREGYGPVPFQISVAGAARLDLSWSDRRVILFAMSLG